MDGGSNAIPVFSQLQAWAAFLVCADAFSRAPLLEPSPMPEECWGFGEYISMVLEERKTAFCLVSCKEFLQMDGMNAVDQKNPTT